MEVRAAALECMVNYGRLEKNKRRKSEAEVERHSHLRGRGNKLGKL